MRSFKELLNHTLRGLTTIKTGRLLVEGSAYIESKERVETLITTKAVLASETNTTFFLALAGGFTVTLPLPAAGLKYRFHVATNPTTSYFIVTNGGADIMAGGINELEVDTASDGPSDLNADKLELTAAFASVGDYVEFVSDGTTWFFIGQTALDGAAVLTTT